METFEAGGSFLEEGSAFGGSFANSQQFSLATGSLQLSCAHRNSPSRQFLTGYTGNRFKTKDVETFKKEIIPAVGFTGSYRGKVNGKVGRIELHRQSLAVGEEEVEDIAVSRKSYHYRSKQREESFDVNPYTSLKYEVSSRRAVARGQSINKILKDIAFKLELKTAGRMQRHLLVRNTFALYDTGGKELCGIDDFYTSLLHLGIMMPNVEFEALCDAFDEQKSGEISWVKFMNCIGAGSMKRAEMAVV